MTQTKTAASFKIAPNALRSADDATMFALFDASTPTPDRENEILFPADFITEYWEQNPIWLWAHDQKQLPIGAGYAPDGTVACSKTEDALILGCRFSQANPNGTLTYALYKEGTLKMVSVGFIGSESEMVPGTKWGINSPVRRILNPELVECSCVPVGMNRGAMLTSIKSWDGLADREAVASIIDKGHIHGEKLTPEFLSMLAPLAAPRGFKLSAWNAGSVRVNNKIPNFSTNFGGKLLALNQSPGSLFMASIAKAPLKAGKTPGETQVTSTVTGADGGDVVVAAKGNVTVDAVVTMTDKTGVSETKPLGVTVKAADTVPAAAKADATTGPDEQITLSVGGQIWKAMMEAAAGMCKGAMDMIPQSDSDDVKTYWQRECGKLAKTVGEWYDAGTKMFPDYAEQFDQAVTMAAEFAALYEEPDAAMPNDNEEEELQGEVDETTEAAETSAQSEEDDTVHIDIGSHNEDDEEEEKAAGEIVTIKAFNEWHAKTFGNLNAKEYLDSLTKSLAERVDALEAAVTEHGKELAVAEEIVAPMLAWYQGVRG